MFDIKFVGATVLDGSGASRKTQDVAIKGGFIAEVSEHISEDAYRVIQAQGLCLSPGFIDMHSHGDLLAFREEPVRSSRVMQGITTDCSGQCGLGPALYTDRISDWKSYILPVIGDAEKASWNWPTFNGFLSEIERQPMRHNQTFLVSHGAVRASVVGLADEEITPEHLQRMKVVLREVLEAGAYGMSFGLSYLPGMYTEKEEVQELAKVLAEENRIFMVHIRSHSEQMQEAIEEMIEVTRVSCVKMHISHLKTYCKGDFGVTPETILQQLRTAWDEGLDITYDEHPYRGGSTTLSQVLPPWIRSGGANEMCNRLNDPGCLSRLEEEFADPEFGVAGWDNFSQIAGWDNILVSSIAKEENSRWANRTISDIAREMQVSNLRAAAKVIFDDEGKSAMMMLEIFSDRDLAKLMKPGVAMVGSDGIPTGRSHPRLYGSFPLFFQKIVREQGVLCMEEAVHRVTGLSASRLGLADRGLIKPGYAADLVLFEEENIVVDEDYMKALSRPKGICEVFVNGKSADTENGKLLRASA